MCNNVQAALPSVTESAGQFSIRHVADIVYQHKHFLICFQYAYLPSFARSDVAVDMAKRL